MPNKNSRDFCGFTLIEVLVALGILITILYFATLMTVTISQNLLVSTQITKTFEAAKKEIDALENYNFSVLYNRSYNPGSELPIPNRFNITNIANSSGVYYVAKMKDVNNTVLDDLLDVEVAVSSKAGNRFLGEDLNLNGVLDTGEDTDNNNKISSPVTLKTLIFKQ
jgi:prepilin-type N-terminal cleavage/methylation domain-containing protein